MNENDKLIRAFNVYHSNDKYCDFEYNTLRNGMKGFCEYIENITINITEMHTNIFKVNNVSNKANVTYNGPGVLDIVIELKGSVSDLPYNPAWTVITDVFLKYVSDKFLPLVGYTLRDFLGVRVLYEDGTTGLIEVVEYLFMATEIFTLSELSNNNNWEIDYIYESVNRITEEDINRIVKNVRLK